MDFHIQKGRAGPLGAQVGVSGINFALFSKHATAATLCLFDPQSKKLLAKIPFHPQLNRTGQVWHAEISGLPLPVLYAYTLDGSHSSPDYYDPDRLLLDPYAKSVASDPSWGGSGDAYTPYGVIEEPDLFDWENVHAPSIPLCDLVIYEMHVRAFTQDPSSNVAQPGSFLGILEKIPYLKKLGINAVELMPIFEFNECENNHNLCNFWGYSSFSFFAPMRRYGSLTEFKTLVRELHRNGIELILDVAFNHTGEKRTKPGFLSWMGIDRSVYFLLEHGVDTNYTGCGNTMKLSHPVCQEMVLDSLRYWASELQVDGFRFDLASIMNRDMQGHLLPVSPLIKMLSLDPILSKTKLIAEPWDAAGAYQLGSFFPSAPRWSEWNGQYRDAVRRFIKGDLFSKNEFADRICGSQSLFPLRSAQAGVNFITAHDGFSLADLVSYNKKHNLANGEGNHDGTVNNWSWNCGVEGETKDTQVLTLRYRQMRNFILALFISRGIPMLLMGDEYGHTKQGNNNTYCQDNALSWFSWESQRESSFYPFVEKMIAFRRAEPLLRQENFLDQESVIWHGMDPSDPAWEHEDPFLAFTLLDREAGHHLYIAFNATDREIECILPNPPLGRRWHLLFDTIADEVEQVTQEALFYRLVPYSSIILKSI